MARPDLESMTPFEAELANHLRAMSQSALRSNSAADVAHRAMSPSPIGVLPPLGWRWAQVVPFMVVLGLLIAFSGWLLATGASQPKPTKPAFVIGPSPTVAPPSASPGSCPTGGAVVGHGWAAPSGSLAGSSSPASGFLAGLASVSSLQGELFAMDQVSGRTTRLTAFGVSDYKFPYLVASPDGSALAFSFQDVEGTDDEKLYVVAGGCTFEPDPAVPWEWDLTMTWSPDSRVLAAMGRPLAEAPTRGRVALLSRDGSPTRYIDLPCAACGIEPSMAWSPAGQWLAAPLFDTNTGSGAEIALVDAILGTSRLIQGYWLVGWYDDTDLLVSTARDGGPLVALPIDGAGSPRPLGWGLPADGTFVLSPDHQQFVQLTQSGSGSTAAQVVSLVEVATGTSRDLWTTPPGTQTQFHGLAWSPDGTAIAIDLGPADGVPDSTAGGVWVVTANGSGARLASATQLSELVWLAPTTSR